MFERGHLRKLAAVLALAEEDEAFRAALEKDVFRTLSTGRIDLSPGEHLALVDIVNDTSFSTLAPRLAPLRRKWKTLGKSKMEK